MSIAGVRICVVPDSVIDKGAPRGLAKGMGKVVDLRLVFLLHLKHDY